MVDFANWNVRARWAASEANYINFAKSCVARLRWDCWKQRCCVICVEGVRFLTLVSNFIFRCTKQSLIFFSFFAAQGCFVYRWNYFVHLSYDSIKTRRNRIFYSIFWDITTKTTWFFSVVPKKIGLWPKKNLVSRCSSLHFSRSGSQAASRQNGRCSPAPTRGRRRDDIGAANVRDQARGDLQRQTLRNARRPGVAGRGGGAEGTGTKV